MVKFQEYNTSDTVVEFVARNNDYPLKSGLVLVCSFVCCIFFTSVRVIVHYFDSSLTCHISNKVRVVVV